MSHKELAESLFEAGYNCAQSVAGAFAEEMHQDLKTITRSTAAMGGGIAKMREVCGCVLGIAYVIGAVEGDFEPEDRIKKGEVYAHVQLLSDKFAEKYGSIICGKLLGIGRDGTSIPGERNAAYKKRPCKEMVGGAAEILEKYLEDSRIS